MTHYKRIFRTTQPIQDVLSHSAFGVLVRPAKNGDPGEFVAETSDPLERRRVDAIVTLFDEGIGQ